MLLELASQFTKLLKKQVVPKVLDPACSPGFYSKFFLVERKDDGFYSPLLTLHSVLQLFKPSSWLAVINLENAYFHGIIQMLSLFQLQGKGASISCLTIWVGYCTPSFHKMYGAMLPSCGLRIAIYFLI